jgi:SAM-dependent methyltransferase
VTAVSEERWQDAHDAERGFWSPGGFGLKRFRKTVAGAMQTAEWARPRLQIPDGDWLEVGIGPLGVGCMHFLRGDASVRERNRSGVKEQGDGELHILDPIELTAADDWQLPTACRALIRSCQETSVAHVGQAELLDFPDDMFALVAMQNMLDHVQDPGAVLREARRVLKPGGSLLMVIDTFSALGKARFRLRRMTGRQRRETIFVRAHPHRFSSKDVVHILAAAGFRMEQADTPSHTMAIAGHGYRMILLAS